jgi:hypothetical protein
MLRRLLVIVALCAASEGCGPDRRAHFETVSLELRPDTPDNDELFRFDDMEAVETLDSDRVRVHYTRVGRNAVPRIDLDRSGVSDYVELVRDRYDEYLEAYATMGYRAPLSDADLDDDNGGDGRFDVYLIDFFGRSDGAFQTDRCTNTCVGYAVQENDFAGYGYPSLDVATQILASHELFHAVQASYDAGQDVIVSEGTAVWATEALEPELDDFERFVSGYLARPERPLNRPSAGVVGDPFAYGSALFFRFLEERFEDPALVRVMWERVEDGTGGVADPTWYEALDNLLAQDQGVDLSEAFADFALWNAFTGLGPKPEGVSYREAGSYPPVAQTEVELPFELERPRHAQLSARYYGFPTGERDTIRVRLVGDFDGMQVWLLLGSGQTVRIFGGTNEVSAAVDGADRGRVVVANTGLEGPSRRASVCLGTPEEVDGCEEALEPEPPDDDPPEDDPPEDDPDPPADPDPVPGEDGADPETDAGGCRTGPFHGAGSALAWALPGFACVAWRRRLAFDGSSSPVRGGSASEDQAFTF